MSIMRLFIRRGLWALLSLSLFAFIAAIFAFIYMSSVLPDVEQLNTVKLQVPMRIFANDGQLIAEYGEKRRIPVTFAEIPKPLINAILSTEDQRFFEHPGVDFLGLMRAAVQLVRTGSKSQGGSTITMQVARNFFLSRKKTYSRKINEILLAIKIDRELSKEKILELYINKIYLGHRAYGFAAAAQVYYGKRLGELNLAQIAMLAGLPKAPSALNPITNPKAALKRRNHVLERLLEENYIDEATYQQTVKIPLTARYHGLTIAVSAPYVAEMVRQAMVAQLGDSAYTQGLQITTTVDGKLQQAANKSLQKGLLAYSKRHGYHGPIKHFTFEPGTTFDWQQALAPYRTIANLHPALIIHVSDKSAHALLKDGQMIEIPWLGLAWARPALNHGAVGSKPEQASDVVRTGDVVWLYRRGKHWRLGQVPKVGGALVALDPINGAIRALTGGFAYRASKFNRAIQAKRQPGSSFKPFVYAAALDKGFTLATLINDAPVVKRDVSLGHLWRPQNASKRFYGPTRLRIGFIRSRNLVSIRILEAIGIDYAIDYISKFGFDKASLPRSLSLALGSGAVTPLELSSGYAVFANGGNRVTPYVIQKITDANGTLLTEPVNSVAPEVISRQVAYLVYSLMRDVIKRGTGRGARVLKRPDLAAKTGTTNDQLDAWFAGFNQHLVATVWVGFDNPQSLHEYASHVALPIWVNFMRSALAGTSVSLPASPAGIVSVKIDPESGLLADPSNAKAIFELFRSRYTPTARAAAPNQTPSNESHDDQQPLYDDPHEHLF